jgi:hypothetical protein
MVPPVLRSTRARTKAATDAAGDSSHDHNKRSRPEASDELEDSSHGYAERSRPDASDAPSDDNDDYFSPAEELLPGTKKRPSKVAMPTQRTRKKLVKGENPHRGRHWVKAPTLHDTSSSGLPRHLPTLGQLRITPSKQTSWTNKWLTAVPNLQVVEKVTPNPIESVDITPLGKMPDMPGRHFKFSVECCDIEVNWDPQKGEEASPNKFSTGEQLGLMEQRRMTRKTWRIFVWNAALPEDTQKRLRLFPEFEPQHSKKYTNWYYSTRPKRPAKPPLSESFIIRGGPLDTTICPTEAEANKVAKEACRLLDKYPGELEDRDFPDSIDLSNRDAISQDSEMRKTIELLSLLTLDSFDFRRLRFVFYYHSKAAPGEYCLRPTPNVMTMSGTGSRVHKLFLPVFILETQKVRGIATSRSKPWPFIEIPDNFLTEKAIQELPDVPSWWGIRHQSPSGIKTGTKLNISATSVTKLADYLCYATFGCFSTLQDLNTVVRDLVNVSDYSFRNKSMAYGPFRGHPLFFPGSRGMMASTEVRKTISGTIPDIWVELPKVARALIMQNAYETFVKTHGDILKTLEEIFVSTDEIILGIASRGKDSYCRCQDDDMKQNTAHYCMFCHRLVLCSRLTMIEDGRTVCIRHLKYGVPTDKSSIIQRIFGKSRKSEQEHGILELHHRHAIRDTLITPQWLLGGEEYQDGYDGTHVDVRRLSPLRVSIDAVFPLCRVEDKWFIHHAENVVLTCEYLNRFKGEDLPMILAAASDAVKSKAPNKYLPDIEQTFDQLFRIRTLIPRGVLDRVALGPKLSSSWWSSFEAMMRSGHWDGTEPLYRFRFLYFKALPHSIWDNDTIQRLAAICAQIEKSPLYNPNNLSLPVGSDGAPWLWNPDHMFHDHSWALLSRIFAHRFWRLDNDCDWTNDHTNESSQTLFLTCVVLWFMLDGGKDEILGLRMTIFTRHSLRFSIGRALHVDPGSVMRTGWNHPYPESLTQFDPSLRTITMESWCMNRGKWQYPVTPENVRLFTDILSSVSAQSPYWDAYPPAQSQRSLRLPQNWRNLQRKPTTGSVEDVESDENFSEGDSDSEDLTGLDWNDTLEDDHDLLELEDDNPADELDRGEKTGGSGERVANDQGQDGGEIGAPSGLFSLQGDAIVDKEELFSDIMAHASLLPEDIQQSFIDKLLRYATWDQSVEVSTSTSIPASKQIPASKAVAASASSSRLGLFKEAITYMIVDHGCDSFMRIEMLANASLDEWKEFHEGIQAPFTAEEILMFCHEMEGKSNFL